MKILFVCTGNICRSPTAQGIMESLAARADVDITCDSAGTFDYHVGEAPDPRAVSRAACDRIDLSAQRARRVTVEDFERFDVIYAMDDGHMQALKAMRPTGARAKLQAFIQGRDVPDPWYGDENNFDETYMIIQQGAQNILDNIKTQMDCRKAT